MSARKQQIRGEEHVPTEPPGPDNVPAKRHPLNLYVWHAREISAGPFYVLSSQLGGLIFVCSLSKN